MGEVEVSIICNSYNHENYIKDALESFVQQKTSFRFEVLIHDDASTDKTADIIREYEQKYPDIIKPIYQKENQYSRRVSITRTVQLPRARGKYIAFCEGDDYWTSDHKLQTQYEIMESHPEIDMCAHGAYILDMRNESKTKWNYPEMDNKIIPLAEVIEKGGGFLPSASLFYRTDIEKRPPQFRLAYGIDYTLQVSGALRGGIYYISEPMCVYRRMNPTSWTATLRKDEIKKIAHKKLINQTMRLMDETTNGKFHSFFTKQIVENNIKIVLLKLMALVKKTRK